VPGHADGDTAKKHGEILSRCRSCDIENDFDREDVLGLRGALLQSRVAEVKIG
jgi:hypothetical protein